MFYLFRTVFWYYGFYVNSRHYSVYCFPSWPHRTSTFACTCWYSVKDCEDVLKISSTLSPSLLASLSLSLSVSVSICSAIFPFQFQLLDFWCLSLQFSKNSGLCLGPPLCVTPSNCLLTGAIIGLISFTSLVLGSHHLFKVRK